MLSALGVGEPSLGRLTSDGELDVAALILAATILILLRLIFGHRIRWPFALATVLAAPLLIGLSHEIGYTFMLALIIAMGAIASALRRSIDPTRPRS